MMSSGPALSRKVLLVVDDDPEIRCLLRRILEPFGKVLEAANGSDALRLIRAEAPELMLLDFSMPMMDGVEATRSIHAERPSIQIFGLSGSEKTPGPHPIELAGAVGYFQKDADMRRLIEHCLAMRASNAPSAARVQ